MTKLRKATDGQTGGDGQRAATAATGHGGDKRQSAHFTSRDGALSSDAALTLQGTQRRDNKKTGAVVARMGIVGNTTWWT